FPRLPYCEGMVRATDRRSTSTVIAEGKCPFRSRAPQGFEDGMRKDIRKRPKPFGNRKAEMAPAGKRVTLPRALSKLGYCSRTQAEDLIAAGRVSLGGRVVIDPETW